MCAFISKTQSTIQFSLTIFLPKFSGIWWLKSAPIPSPRFNPNIRILAASKRKAIGRWKIKKKKNPWYLNKEKVLSSVYPHFSIFRYVDLMASWVKKNRYDFKFDRITCSYMYMYIHWYMNYVYFLFNIRKTSAVITPWCHGDYQCSSRLYSPIDLWISTYVNITTIPWSAI